MKFNHQIICLVVYQVNNSISLNLFIDWQKSKYFFVFCNSAFICRVKKWLGLYWSMYYGRSSPISIEPLKESLTLIETEVGWWCDGGLKSPSNVVRQDLLLWPETHQTIGSKILDGAFNLIGTGLFGRDNCGCLNFL